MRPSILPNLIDAARRNEARGLADPALFEVGPHYKDATPTGQRTVAAGLRQQHGGAAQLGGAGRAPSTPSMPRPMRWPCWPRSARRSTTCRPSRARRTGTIPAARALLKLGDRVMAQFGELHPEIVAGADLKGPVAAFEVFLDAPPLPKAKATKARPKLVLSAFQPVERDFAFIVDADGRGREAGARRAQRRQGADRRARACSTSMPARACPTARSRWRIAVTLQPVERTLTDAEIEAVEAKIVAQVAKATGATLRG